MVVPYHQNYLSIAIEQQVLILLLQAIEQQVLILLLQVLQLFQLLLLSQQQCFKSKLLKAFKGRRKTNIVSEWSTASQFGVWSLCCCSVGSIFIIIIINNNYQVNNNMSYCSWKGIMIAHVDNDNASEDIDVMLHVYS